MQWMLRCSDLRPYDKRACLRFCGEWWLWMLVVVMGSSDGWLVMGG